MEDYFRANYLLKDEIDYELRIRGVVTDRNVNDKRKMLACLLNKERQANSNVLKLVDPSFDFDKESKEIESTIDSVKTLISDFEGPSADSIYLRARTRILHLTKRILRIKLDEIEADKVSKQKFKDEAYASAMFLDADLHERVKEPIPLKPSDLLAQPSSSIQPLNNSNAPLSQHYYSPYPVYKLGITFDGDSRNVLSFIERITEIAHSRHVSKTDLYESASELFSGKALFWLRHVKSTVSDWDSLLAKLKSDFLSSDIDEELWKQIKERKQLKHEPSILYIAIMEGLFRRLTNNPVETTKVKYTIRGLHKEYRQRLALQDIDSVDKLSSLCKRLEEADILDFSSNSSSRQVLELSDDRQHNAFKSTKSRNSAKDHKPNKVNNTPLKKVSTTPSIDSKNSTSNNLKCWNCGETNHVFKHCRSTIKKKFCFRCGSPNVTIKTCARCSGNEQ